jgi:predicted HTH domain antitoxin
VSREGEPYVFMVDASAILGMTQASGSPAEVSARQLLAAHLFDQGALSIGRGARLAGLPVDEFVDLCDRLHISILRQPAENLAKEVDEFEAWLKRIS